MGGQRGRKQDVAGKPWEKGTEDLKKSFLANTSSVFCSCLVHVPTSAFTTDWGWTPSSCKRSQQPQQFDANKQADIVGTASQLKNELESLLIDFSHKLQQNINGSPGNQNLTDGGRLLWHRGIRPYINQKLNCSSYSP